MIGDADSVRCDRWWILAEGEQARQNGLGGATAVVGVVNVATGLVAILINVVLASWMAPDEFGAYAVFLASVTVLAIVGGLGIGPLVIRDMASARVGVGGNSARSVALAACLLVAGATLFVVLGVLSPFGTSLFEDGFDLPGSAVVAIAFVATSMAIGGLAAEVHRGRSAFLRASVLGYPLQRFVLLTALGFWYLGTTQTLDFGLVVRLTVISGGISLLVSVILLVRWLWTIPLPRPTNNYLASTARGTIPLASAAVAAFAISRLPIWFLGWEDRLTDAAAFALALTFAGLVVMVDTIISQTLPPFVAARRHQGHVATSRLAQRTAFVGTLVTLPVSVLVLAGALVVVPRQFGADYSIVPALLSVLLVALLVSSALGPAGLVLNLTGFQRWNAVISGAELGMIGLIMFLGSTGLSVLGITVVVSIAFVSGRVARWFLSWRILGVRTDAIFTGFSCRSR